MITFYPVCIRSNKRKDGTTPVKIRVTYKGKSRRLPTNLVCQPSDLTKTYHIKNQLILNKCSELIKKMRGTLADLSLFEIEDWDIDKVISHIRKGLQEESFKLDFFAWSDSYLSKKEESTRRAYVSALGALERFLQKRELDINCITKALLLDFVSYVDSEPKMSRQKDKWIATDKRKKTGASSRHLMKLSHLFNAAKERFNDDDKILIPRSPFNIQRDYGVSQGEEALPIEVFRKIRNEKSFATDVFCLSFFLMGVNLADLWYAKDVQEIWEYRRRKTGAPMKVVIPDEAKEYIERLRGKGDWWLNELHKFKNKDICTARVNAGLKRWARREGVKEFNLYAARKSWATYARNLARVEKATVDECLAHKGDYQMADIYITKSWDLINEANRKTIQEVISL